MALFHENMRQILSEFEKFINETLKKETKLSKKTLEHKHVILEKLAKFYLENPQMLTSPDTLQVREADESSMTGGSSKSDESEEVNYIDAGIGFVGVADLKDPVYSGVLEKKQRRGSGLLGPKFQTRFCVINAGVFYYFEKQKDKKQCGSFKMEGYKFRNAPDITTKKKDKELAFEVYSDDDSRRVYQFVAKSKPEYDQWQQFVECGGQPLIEEDIYDEVGNGPPPLPPSSSSLPQHAPVQDEEYIDDVQVQMNTDNEPGEMYIEPDKDITLHVPAQPPSKGLRTPPATPGVTETSAPVPLIEEDIYDEAMSKEMPPPSVPERPPPPPEAPPPVGKRQRPPINKDVQGRELPATPTTPDEKPAKKRIKVTITCKPEEDFENRYYGKWNCSADKGNELSFKKGDIIYILSKEFDAKSWWVGELNGKFGLVPKTFLVPAFTLAE